MKSSQSIRNLTLAALFAAMICLTTAYLFHIPVGTAGGYIHLGDAFVYLASTFLPVPYAMAAAGIGAGLADVLTPDAIQWAPFTVVIKAAMVLMFTAKKENILCVRNVVAGLPAGVICTVGYYFAEVVLYGNWITPFLSMPMAFVQSGGGMALFLLCGAVLDKANIKTHLRRLS